MPTSPTPGSQPQIPDAERHPLLTPAETGEALGISTSNVYRMVRAGELPTIQLGGRKSTRIITAQLRLLLGLEASPTTDDRPPD